MSATERLTYWLRNPQQRAAALYAVSQAPDGHVVTVRPPTRTVDQNALLHAMLTEVAASGAEWGGCRRTMDEWKVLFISAHAIATGREQEVVRGLEDEPVALRESSAAMSRERLGSLIDYIAAWCASHGIKLRGPG